ncbi:MAG: ubiquinone biosynthesis protein COQ9 [Myxococcota bacterium]|jgi:ubiquinone biosynthesis protein COQ9
MLIDSLTNKQKILDHFLESCLFEGWSDKALEEAFAKAEIDIKFLPFIFENGAADIADFFINNIDDKMLEMAKDFDFETMKIRDKIKNLVKIRLKINQTFKPQIQKLITFYLKPQNSPLAFKSSYKTADLMWKIAGDNATDFNFYSKRMILAKIYIRTLLSFSKDESINNQKTLNLLDKEIEKVIKFTAFKFKVKNSCQKASKILKKAANLKSDFKQNPKNFIKSLPFFRLYK